MGGIYAQTRILYGERYVTYNNKTGRDQKPDFFPVYYRTRIKNLPTYMAGAKCLPQSVSSFFPYLEMFLVYLLANARYMHIRDTRTCT